MANIVIAAQRQRPREQIGTAAQLIHRVIRAERRAAGDNTETAATTIPNIRHDFIANIFIVLHLAPCHRARMHLAVQPRLAIDAVD
jgi:hypothetical protein